MSDDDDNVGLWQHLKTVTLFDKNKTKVVHVPKKNVGPFSQASLLVESLIEYICTLVEKDTTQQKQLYSTICQKLYELQLIDETYSISDFDFIRNHYRKELYRLVNVAKSVAPVIRGQYTVPVPALLPDKRKSSSSSKFFDWSRFSSEYHELEFIARGGFGEVVKVQNKLDAGIYAIKKICLKYCDYNSFIRGLTEVQMLAKLNHPNIVSYRAAWVEPVKMEKKSRKSKEVIHSMELTYSKKEESSDVIFMESDGSRTSDEKETKAELISSSDTHSESSPEHLVNCINSMNGDSIYRNVLDYEIEEINQQIVHERDQVCNKCSRHQDWAVLFIQMQLCHQTLRQWLDKRNLIDCSPIDIQESLDIYLQIVRGVEFIHSKGIVHHDIKPTNIFLNQDGQEVQVGDFGLSCCWLHDTCPEAPTPSVITSPYCPVSVTHQPGEIGTKLYAAPEQLNGICDFKSDLFSLGILVFELVYLFHTNMERVEKINQLRKGILPSDLENTFPNITKLIKRLTDANPEVRPVSGELMKEVVDILNKIRQQEEDSNTIIKRLREELCRKNEEIALLRQRLSSLQKVTE